uniref:Uncharacterized protein n=1 Tax=viral metagenome TaxID=1070528 RepID=A0A6H1ZNV2_9ZZZZ
MAEIRANDIVIVTADYSPYAGNISEIRWNYKQFILQSDSGFITGIASGSSEDTQSYGGENAYLYASGNYLENRIRMKYGANWVLSNDYCTAKVTIGFAGRGRVIEYLVTHELAVARSGENQKAFETMEAGMPPEFKDNFFTYDYVSNSFTQVGSSGGGYAAPIIIKETDQFVFGIYSPDTDSDYTNVVLSYPDASYPNEKSMVRFSPTLWRYDYVPAGTYSFRNYICIGTLESVRADLRALIEYFGVTISFTYPTDGETVSGILDAVTVPSENVVNIKYYIDNVYLFEEQDFPYGFSLDTNSYPNGLHTFKAVAYNLDGDAGEALVTVTFDNVHYYDYEVVVSVGTHGLSSDVLNLTEHKTLVVGNAVHALSLDAPTLDWSWVLVVDNGLSVMTSYSIPSLSGSQILQGLSAYLANGSVVADGSIKAGTNFYDFHELITIMGWDTVLRGLWAFSADGSYLADGSITAGINLGALHEMTSDSPYPGALLVDSLQHLLSTPSIDITQAQLLAVNNSSHLMLSDGVVLTQDYYLALANALHALASSELDVVENKTLEVSDLLSNLISDETAVIYEHMLAMQNVNHKVTSPHFDYLEWFGDWRDYKRQAPWVIAAQENKWGYLNNPRWMDRG